MGRKLFTIDFYINKLFYIMKEHQINKLNNFICGWYSDKLDFYDKIIDEHINKNEKQDGRIGDRVDKKVKNSIDSFLTGDLRSEYIQNHLQPMVNEYIKKYKYCNHYSSWGIREPILIQQYEKNGGFYEFHTEKTTIYNSPRHLVFMTYLNDVTEGGETEFYYQNIKVKPEKGLTLIWGSDWTFTHRGIPSTTQEKFIVTGWFGFLE